MEYAALAVWCFSVALIGGFVGLVMGNIRLPAVLALASSPAAGAGTNIGISAVAAAAASVAHVRAGRVNWRLFAWMAPPSVIGALAGGYLSGVLPGDALLVGIAAVLAYSGVDLLRWRPRRKGAVRTDGSAPAAEGPAAVAEGPALNVRAAVLAGVVIGLLGGIVGLILGSLRMPALIRYVGEAPARAVGTNVTVGFCVGVAGVIGHVPTGAPDWGLLAIGALASIPGALLGSLLTGRVSEERLIQGVAIALFVAAAGMLATVLA